MSLSPVGPRLELGDKRVLFRKEKEGILDVACVEWGYRYHRYGWQIWMANVEFGDAKSVVGSECARVAKCLSGYE